jgi:hypothetical protein
MKIKKFQTGDNLPKTEFINGRPIVTYTRKLTEPDTDSLYHYGRAAREEQGKLTAKLIEKYPELNEVITKFATTKGLTNTKIDSILSTYPDSVLNKTIPMSPEYKNVANKYMKYSVGYVPGLISAGKNEVGKNFTAYTGEVFGPRNAAKLYPYYPDREPRYAGFPYKGATTASVNRDSIMNNSPIAYIK